ncbi:hypothetical protein MIND_00145600 [Mycena indigotica]|uniref:Aminoglycoside phosphotransferase domain-containing protein n=1 Tax=Mycena indigotica TaxID=2126181 RepID=A0A8H6WKZ5_9AGAR|nr:uncharacterized protein MIND_00145600 [Mycena indigotica]KAF7316269.1 hypothetical protein MIND_00145600 [Mycena indigotica]
MKVQKLADAITIEATTFHADDNLMKKAIRPKIAALQSDGIHSAECKTSLRRVLVNAPLNLHEGRVDGYMTYDTFVTQYDQDKLVSEGDEVHQAAQGAQKFIEYFLRQGSLPQRRGLSYPAVITTIRRHVLTVSFFIRITEPGASEATDRYEWSYDRVASINLRPPGTSTKLNDQHSLRLALFFTRINALNVLISRHYRTATAATSTTYWPLCKEAMCSNDAFSLVYQSRINPKDPRTFYAMYKPTSDDHLQPRVVVCKLISSRYGSALHTHLAKHQLAPSLLHLNPLPTPLNFRLVVMDKIDAICETTGSNVNGERRQQLTRLLEILRLSGLVHGDLRPQNILFSTDGVKIIDFDWAGADGTSYYPLNLNETLVWHKGVKGGSAMQHEHDRFQVDLLLNPDGVHSVDLKND